MTKQSKRGVYTIVILHGWGSSPERWDAVLTAIKRIAEKKKHRVNVYIPSLPGFSSKFKIDKAYSIDDYTHWLQEYLKKHSSNKLLLVGHSHGGRILIRYASQHQDLKARLILMNAAGIPNIKLFPTMKRRAFKVLATIGKVILYPLAKTPLFPLCKKVLYKLAREHDYEKATPVMQETMQNVLTYNARPDIPHIIQRTSLIWGKHDTATPLWMGHLIQKLLQNVSSFNVLDGKHGLHLSHPNAVASLLIDEIA